ncbi:MAG: hypothetical protein DMF92_14470 [Acidobacteria bacterium]|nr:MAG: hypothetical protein DMF92_14470 [Acidobacteriota bacterium]
MKPRPIQAISSPRGDHRRHPRCVRRRPIDLRAITQLTPQDSIFFDQIGQGLLRLPIQLVDQRGKKNPQGGHVTARVYSTDRDPTSGGRWTEPWDITDHDRNIWKLGIYAC